MADEENLADLVLQAAEAAFPLELMEDELVDEPMEEDIIAYMARHHPPVSGSMVLSSSQASTEESTQDFHHNLEINVRNYLKMKNEEDIATIWLNSAPEKVAQELIVQSWFRRLVPRIYAPNKQMNLLTPKFNDKLANEILIEPLEKYIFGNEDPEIYKQKMKETCSPASVCGKVFKPGEPTYGCRDCGLDPTCVLCVECFKNSMHQKHRYKISTSTGGGYCDCGDNEAWRKDFYCSSHDPDLVSGKRTSLEQIQSGLKERIDLILNIIVNYCYCRFLDDNIVQLSSPHLALTDSDREELDLKENLDAYCTAMINDEIHTFEVVILTLQRAINCTKPEAKEFATMIDREGRSVVFISDFNECAKVKQVIERQTSRTGQAPLRVEVLHSFIVAHQIFALKLMDWLKSIVSLAPEVREIFSEIMSRTEDLVRPNNKPFDFPKLPNYKYIFEALERADYVTKQIELYKKHCANPEIPLPNCIELQKELFRGKALSYLSGILQSDTRLWKAQRNSWHNLIIAGLLRDYEIKKQFAVEFTYKYPELFKEFINDDHDHAISVTSLSVQIYTVPTIAHKLIEEHDALFQIMRTFLSEFEQKYSTETRLQLQRTPNGPFKRAQYAILDLKYLLSNAPSPSCWNEPLRKAFIHGIANVVKLLGSMQNMDPVVRQTGSHAEYEPEWESAFNFHIKLTPVTSLIQQWCSTDAQICIRTYRLALKEFLLVIPNKPAPKTCCRELFNHSVTCYEYDVMSQEVSVHLALSRFIAGMHLHLGKFDLNFNSEQLNMTDKPTPLQLVEPSLRMLVLVAQVHCGLWKRNGYALLNQIYFYHNVRCRSDMLDKDVIALQLGASLIESNEYMIHVLNRYNLIQWADEGFDGMNAAPNDEETIRHTVGIAEQFLELINTIVTARFTVGLGKVSQKDCVQNEIIQYLCKDSMTHSQLNKVLVENVNCETGLEQYIQEVATFKKTTNSKAGYIYELKPEYYEKYDIFHYHFTHEEKSTAEERQRSRKKAAGEAEYFPPPKLPLFTCQFSLVPNLLMSDVMLNLMGIIMQRAMKKFSRSYSDTQLRFVLHLIGVGLNEEMSRKEVGTEDFFQFTTAARKWKVFDHLEKLLQETSLAQHHDLIVWIFRKYQELKPSEDLGTIENLVQLSQAEDEKAKKKKLAASIREKRLAEMKACQNNFYSVNADLFQEDESTADAGSADVHMISDIPIALGVNQTARPPGIEKFMCILCHTEQTLQEATSPFVQCSYVQRSTVLSQSKELLRSAEMENAGDLELVQRDPLFLQPDLLYAPHVSCCGHAMHSVCWRKHYESIVLKERRRTYRNPSCFNVDHEEYLCPMCGCLSNSTLIVSEPCFLARESPVAENYPQMNDFGNWVNMWVPVLSHKVHYSCKHTTHVTNERQIFDHPERADELNICVLDPECYDAVTYKSVADRYFKLRYQYYFNKLVPAVPRVYLYQSGSNSIAHSFLQVVYMIGLAFDRRQTEADYRVPIMTWQAVAYTISSFEAAHREIKIPFFGPTVPIRQSSTMKHLARSGSVLTRQINILLYEKDDSIHSLGIQLMELALNTSGCSDNSCCINKRPRCILDIDAFFLLVSLTYVSEVMVHPAEEKEIVRGGSDIICLKDLFILKTVTIVHLAQIFIAIDIFNSKYYLNHERLDDKKTVLLQEMENNCFGKSCKKAWKILKVSPPAKLDWIKLYEDIFERAKPFLKCAAKFYESLTGIPARDSLHNLDPDVNELLDYLGMSSKPEEFFSEFGIDDYSFVKLFNNKRLIDIVEANRNKTRIDGQAGMPEVKIVEYPRYILEWPDLPKDYIELINIVSTFTCRNLDDNESRNPTKCMVCGTVLCSQSYCCQFNAGGSNFGACTYHSFHCGGGTGIFLRIRECKMFFLCNKGKGAFVFPPYVDAYGETDQGLRRGNPMSLCIEKIQKYRKSWIMHSIPEDIARINENSTTITVAEWQYL